jgi:hypothetical protein
MRAPFFFPSILILLCLTTAGAFGAPENDIKLIIDVSGSMKKNDPDNLRRPAVNLLVNLLPEDASAAVWLFGDKVESLVPFGVVTPEFKTFAIGQSELIHSRGLLTDIGGALEQSMLQDHRGGKAILLSDGMVDLGPDPAENLAEQTRIQTQLIPQLVANNAEVHTVALSDNADRKVLEAVAQGTGGLFEVATTADDLTRIFLRLFDDAVIQDRLPIEQGKFLVDSSVEEFTLLAFRGVDSAAVQIRSPDDQYFLIGDYPEAVSWYRDAGFDLITVSRPVEGEWRLFSDEDPENRVSVLSDLKLDVTNLENVLHDASFPVLEVRFLQGPEVITEPTFLALMDLQLVVLTPSGNRIAKPLGDPVEGIFTTNLGFFAEPGRYRVSVNVDGKSFRREVVQEIEYVTPALVVFSATDRAVSVRPVAVGLLGEELRMIARLESEQNQKRMLPMLSNGELWQVSLQDVPDGKYRLVVHVKGVAKTGQTLDFDLEHQLIELKPQELLEPLESIESEAWSLKEWGIAAAVVSVNLVLLMFAIWLFRRRGQGALPESDQADVNELLTQGPEAESKSKPGKGSKVDDSDEIAALASAEALLEKDQELQSDVEAEVAHEAEKKEVEKDAELKADLEIERAIEPEVGPAVEPELEPEIGPDVESEVEPEVGPDVDPEVEPEVGPDVESEVEPEVGPDVDPEVEPEVEPEVGLDVEPEVGSEVDPEVEPEVEPEVGPDVDPDVEPEVEPEVGLDVEPEVGPEADPEVEPEVGPDVDPEVEPEVGPEVDPEVEPEVKVEIEPEVESRTDRESDTADSIEPQPAADDSVSGFSDIVDAWGDSDGKPDQDDLADSNDDDPADEFERALQEQSEGEAESNDLDQQDSAASENTDKNTDMSAESKVLDEDLGPPEQDAASTR